jgi:hypothetical protein
MPGQRRRFKRRSGVPDQGNTTPALIQQEKTGNGRKKIVFPWETVELQ